MEFCVPMSCRWLVDGSEYHEKLPDENGVSRFTITVNKDKTTVRCEAQNRKAIDSKTAYITVSQGIYRILVP